MPIRHRKGRFDLVFSNLVIVKCYLQIQLRAPTIMVSVVTMLVPVSMVHYMGFCNTPYIIVELVLLLSLHVIFAICNWMYWSVDIIILWLYAVLESLLIPIVFDYIGYCLTPCVVLELALLLNFHVFLLLYTNI